MITIQPMRSQDQSYLVLVLVIFPAFEKVTGDWNSDWFVTLFAPVVIGRSVYLVVVFRQ